MFVCPIKWQLRVWQDIGYGILHDDATLEQATIVIGYTKNRSDMSSFGPIFFKMILGLNWILISLGIASNFWIDAFYRIEKKWDKVMADQILTIPTKIWVIYRESLIKYALWWSHFGTTLPG